MGKILLTGANSFVGKNYIASSQFNDIEEVCLIERKIDDIEFSKYETIIHLAAIVHQSAKIPEATYYEVNRDLCIEVAKAAKIAGVKQFIFLSTMKVYGTYKKGQLPWNENSECFPDDSYGKSKLEAENILKEIEDDQFIVSIIRTPLVYGAGVKANMLNIIRLIDKISILPLGNTNNKRSFTAVENLVGYIDRIIELRSSGVFITMDEKPLSTTELARIIAKNMNKKVYLFKLPKVIIRIGLSLFPRIFERLFGSFELNNELTLKKLDFELVISAHEAIGNMVKDYLLRKGNVRS